MMQQILKFFLLVYTFLLPLQTRYFLFDSSVEYQRVSLYGTQILFLLIVIFYFLHLIRHSSPVSKYGVNCSWNPVFFLFVLFVVIQMIISTRVDLTIQALLWIFQAVLFVWIVRREKLERMVLWTFVASMALEALVIWVQFFTQYIPSLKWLGVAEHISSVGGVSVIETFDSRWLRGYGTFPHPNIAGGFLLIALLAFLRLTTPPVSSSSQVEGKRWGNYPLSTIHYPLLGILVSGLVLTFSRSALLGFIIFIFMGFFIHFFRRTSSSTSIGDLESQNKQKKNSFVFFFSFLDSCHSLPRTFILGRNDGGGGYLKFILISAVFFLVMTVPLRDLIFFRTSTSTRLEKISIEQRIEYNRSAREIMRNNLWFGVGLGNYTVAVQRKIPNQLPHTYQPPHSVLLLMVTEIGVVGAVLLILLFIIWLRVTRYALRVTILFSLLPLLLFDHYLWSLYAGWGVIALAGVQGEYVRVPEE